MEIKAVFFDVDGTLVSHTKRNVPESTKIVMEKLKEKGIKRILATGRHMSEIDMLPIENMEFDAYIMLNGQLCLDSARNIILENPISGSDKEYLIKLFREKVVPIMFVEKDEMYINFINDNVVVAQDAISTPLPDIKEYTGNEIYQVILYADEETENIISKNLVESKITRWNEYALDVISASGGKESGIKEYLKINNINKKETMAFGDGENDIDMLKLVGIGVAMGNAEDCVKESADYITSSVDDGGIMKAFNKFIK